MRRLLAIVITSCLAACSPPPGTESRGCEWVGTTTTEGAVTTVANESGSVWCGSAALVEEASIGVDAGDDPYMFGAIQGIGVADNRIFVLDDQVKVIRVYDLDGSHLMDIGAEGDGPGEFRRPTALGIGAGRLFVRDETQGRITVFGTEGRLLDTWPMEPRFDSRSTLVIAPDGALYIPQGRGMYPRGPDGVSGEPVLMPASDFSRPQFTHRVTETIEGWYSAGATISREIPFWPSRQWVMAPDTSTIDGVSDTYRFERTTADGRSIVVEQAWDPVPVTEAEAEWHRRDIGNFFRYLDPGWSWDQPDIPSVKPAFSRFIPTHTGEAWLVRPGPGYRIADCPEPAAQPGARSDPCWKDERLVDGFDAEGRFLGSIDVPASWRLDPQPWIEGDTVIAVVENEAGTIMVKRYRLAPPDLSD